MIIVMKGSAPKADVEHVIKLIEEMGYQSHVIWGTQRTVIGAVGDERGKARLTWRASYPSCSRSS
jgi:3-deoxy-7-phosphoheptulonate synthase